MTAITSYSTGTISVAANGTAVTGVGTIWSGTNVRPGDILQIGNFQTIITDVTDPTHLVIPPWGGGAQAGVAYVVWKVSQQRIAGAQAMADVSALVAALNTTGFFWFVDVSLAAPDPSLGSDGQYALQPTTGKMWVHAAGVWTYLGIYKGFSFRGAYDNAAVYSVGDVQTTAGTSYVWINPAPGSGHPAPDANYWQVLAAKGDKGDTGAVPWSNATTWATGTNYVAAPPASVVVHPINKNLYVCIVPHLSGNFATDLAAGKWLLISQSATEAASGTALAIGVGTRVFSAVTGFSYQNGVRLRASSNGSPTNWMEGVCLYDPAAQIITMTVDKTGGAGTFGDWNFNRVGQPGAGDLTSSLNLSELTNKPAALVNLGVPGVLAGYLSGLKITSPGAVSSFSVSPGVACDRNAADMIILSAGLTKTSAAFAAGNNQGCLDTGALANGFYHVFVIRNPTGSGSVDILMSKSATAPWLPNGYTLFRRIGAVWYNSGGLFSQLLQRGREFFWPGSAMDYGTTTLGPTLTTFALASVPSGIQVLALVNIIGWSTAQNTMWWTHEVGITDNGPGYGVGGNGLEVTTVTSGNVADLRVWTNTSAQICARSTTANTTYRCFTRGWFDPLEG
ncbi:hypothetical protein [Bradyrhizobium viridifuturi]|uniref:hypothetical protein n=1 Tax=Bradyrhizobium viridifuturi TaxID=1654716 RepID=UPI00067E97A2|nr:hypothetical protein [Bradyrhizobium viridifuturi]